jgi:hypothetical protein
MIIYNHNLGFTPPIYVKDSPALPPTTDDYYLQVDTTGVADGYLLCDTGGVADGSLYFSKETFNAIMCRTAGTVDGYLLSSGGQLLIN